MKEETVTLNALSRLERCDADHSITTTASEFQAEMDKGLTDSKRPISDLLNHCEVAEAGKDSMSAYKEFAKSVKHKGFVAGIDTYRPEADPFRKEKA